MVRAIHRHCGLGQSVPVTGRLSDSLVRSSFPCDTAGSSAAWVEARRWPFGNRRGKRSTNTTSMPQSGRADERKPWVPVASAGSLPTAPGSGKQCRKRCYMESRSVALRGRAGFCPCAIICSNIEKPAPALLTNPICTASATRCCVSRTAMPCRRATRRDS